MRLTKTSTMLATMKTRDKTGQRSRARRAGKKTYFTGRACVNGHVSKRSVSGGGCLECQRNRTAIYRATNRERNRPILAAYGRKRKGLPEPTRPEPKLCEICDGPPNGVGGLHLDHDHRTGAFRGWLCSKCNTGIAMLGDTSAGVAMAVAYLLRAR